MVEELKRSVIYFVDDEPAVCKAVKQTLETLNCRVICFSNAEDCLRSIEMGMCDLLISDVNMPGMDGVELLRMVKRVRPMLPVLLVTGYGDIPVAVKAVKAGAMDFIEKPLDENTFLPVVKRALEEHERKSSLIIKPLTKTERKILQLVVDGKGNKEIANMLTCSVRTVENHRYRISKKMNVDSTASMVRLAITLGLASPNSGGTVEV
jgi:FixJ family two-component response regulator